MPAPMPDFALRLDETETEAVVTVGDVDIARYAFDPGGAVSEGPKPFLHPLRALDGAPLTAFRPWDHRWHKGLQMTWTHVSGQNFWGGNSYRPETGDYALLDNVGRMRHDEFTAVTDAGPEVSFTERLTWITQAGDEWLTETRTHRFHGLDLERGLWVLDFQATLRNISGREPRVRQPHDPGPPWAGYTGLRCSGCRVPGRAAGCSRHRAKEPKSSWAARRHWVAFCGRARRVRRRRNRARVRGHVDRCPARSSGSCAPSRSPC